MKNCAPFPRENTSNTRPLDDDMRKQCVHNQRKCQTPCVTDEQSRNIVMGCEGVPPGFQCHSADKLEMIIRQRSGVDPELTCH